MRRLFYFFCLYLFGLPVVAEPPDRSCSEPKNGHQHCVRKAHYTFDLCASLDEFSRRHQIDPHYFTRLIWQESRFDPYAQSHAGAQGIAQFIPSTAKLRDLTDPFNPALALEASAKYLSGLSEMFGNLGLAAVAYNAGETAAQGFIDLDRSIPRETRDYVHIITGLEAEIWRDSPPEKPEFDLSPEVPFQQACHKMAKSRRLSKPPQFRPPQSLWGVQVASGATRKKAEKNYRRLTRSCAGMLKKENELYIFRRYRASLTRGFFAVRIGRDTRADAAWLCKELRTSGCICAVYKNKYGIEYRPAKTLKNALRRATADQLAAMSSPRPVPRPWLPSNLPLQFVQLITAQSEAGADVAKRPMHRPVSSP